VDAGEIISPITFIQGLLLLKAYIRYAYSCRASIPFFTHLQKQLSTLTVPIFQPSS
jgi:hypothetical protein